MHNIELSVLTASLPSFSRSLQVRNVFQQRSRWTKVGLPKLHSRLKDLSLVIAAQRATSSQETDQPLS